MTPSIKFKTHKYHFRSLGTWITPPAKFRDRRWILLFSKYLISLWLTVLAPFSRRLSVDLVSSTAQAQLAHMDTSLTFELPVWQDKKKMRRGSWCTDRLGPSFPFGVAPGRQHQGGGDLCNFGISVSSTISVSLLCSATLARCLWGWCPLALESTLVMVLF
jgi:hypothetical protein